MKPEISLTHFHAPATYISLQPSRSSLYSHTHLRDDPSKHYSRILACVSQVDSFPQISPSKPCILFSSSPYALHAPPISFFSILSPEKYCVTFTLCSFLHFFFNSSLLLSNIFLSTLLSNNLSLRFSLNVSDQVSHPQKTTDKIYFCIN